MKILLVTPSFEPTNGWGTYSLGLLKGLQRRGHTVSALVQKKTPNLPCPQFGGLPDPLSMLSSAFARAQAVAVLWLAKQRCKPDVMHFLVEPYTLAIPTMRHLSIPWVMNLHGTYTIQPFEKPKTAKLLCEVYHRTSGMLAASKYTAHRTLAAIKIHCGPQAALTAEPKIRRLHLGIEMPMPRPANVHSDIRHILFVGEVKPRKGVMELIDGVAAFHARSPVPFVVDIVGNLREDEFVSRLRSAIRDKGLEKIVRLRGRVSTQELDDAYASADVFMMLSKSVGSHFEGFGLVFLEANARGIPTIGSSDSGCKEAISEGTSGYAVDATNPQEIAERLQWILGDHRIKSDDCLAWAREHSLERQAEECETLYREVSQNDRNVSSQA